MKKIIMCLIVTAIFTSTVNATEVPRESAPCNASNEAIVIVESFIGDILTEVQNGLGYADARAKSNQIFSNAWLNGQTNGYSYGELVDIANAAIWQYRDMYLRPDFYANNLERVRVIIAPVIEDYKSGNNYLGHSVNQPLPALTGLISNGKFLKDWDKIRSDARVTLIVNGKALKSDTGEIQLTSKGVSGICVFNISGLTAKHIHQGDSIELEINFMPNLEKGFYEWFDTRCSNFLDMTLETALESIFNYKLMFVLFEKAKVNRDMLWANMNNSQRRSLCDVIEHFRIPIIDTENYEKAQVCTGGVPVSEINPANMESLVLPGVHFVGEVLDVDGQCGGYNLAFAFVSGYVAGKSV